MRNAILRICRIASGLTLLMFGLAKLISWSGLPLTTIDPILGIPQRYLMLGLAGFETVCGVLLLKSGRIELIAVVLWFSIAVLCYRFALIFVAPGLSCPCLGSAYAWFGISRSSADKLSMIAAIGTRGDKLGGR